MSVFFKIWMVTLVILVSASHCKYSEGHVVDSNGIKTVVHLSPKFVMGAGSVVDKFYYNIDFPKGHIAIKSFNAEVVDEAGNPVPLHETYLHHWVVVRYHQRSHTQTPQYNNGFELQDTDISMVRNSGICDDKGLGQYFGLGSETRKTSTSVPDPYGIEVGNPADIPPGYEERWLLNVHAIDTRGVEDRMGCTECRRDLYNVTKDGHGRPLPSDYIGGLGCCYDDTQCKVKEGLQGRRRGLYMRYTIKWVDWDDSVVPVKIYIFDITDTWNPKADRAKHICKVEYNVESCSRSNMVDNKCADVKRTSLTLPTGGHVIYGVAHQHSGGIGSALFGEDGRVICTSMPTYGEGKEPGNESGYIVGMSTCYPQPGSVKIRDGERLLLESNYSSTKGHTGVMGLFYILVAEPPQNSSSLSYRPIRMLEHMNLSTTIWSLAFLAFAIAMIVGFVYGCRDRTVDSYQAITA